MKATIFIIFFSLGICSLTFSQKQINTDTLKQEIIKEVNILIQQSTKNIENSIKDLNETIKQQSSKSSEMYTNETIVELINSAKAEAINAANEIFTNRSEKLLVEVEKLISQSNSELMTNINQLITETKTELTENTQILANKAGEKAIIEAVEEIENMNSGSILTLEELIEGEKNELMKMINKQNLIISELQKRIEELEKAINQ